MKRLCIFDFDGTTANTLTSIAGFGNRALEKNGLPPLDLEQYRQMVGNGAVMLLKRMVRAAYGMDSEEYFTKVKADYDAMYAADPTLLVTPYEGMQETLRQLKADGWLLAVNSNKPDPLTKRIAASMYGKDFFDYVLGQRDDILKKPAPDGALRIMKALDADPACTFYIGDSDVDIATGKNAGLRVIGAAWGFRGREELLSAGADSIAETPRDLLDLLSC